MDSPVSSLTPRPWVRTHLAVLAAVVGIFGVLGGIGLYRYVEGFWLYRGFPPPKDAPWVKTQGHLETIRVVSRALGGRSQQVLVYLPPGYDSNQQRRYPVLYLLHGTPGGPTSMFNALAAGVVEDELVARHKMQPLILVLPNGSTSFFEDKEWANGIAPGQAWETFVARDVVRAIDKRYRTIPRAAGRAIAGLSEGGYGALNIGFHHPNLFRVLESWSGYMRADPIVSIFGKSPARLAYNSPLLYLPKVARALRRGHVRIWFYVCKHDEFPAENYRFASLLNTYRVPHTFLVVAGGHNWGAWRRNAPAAFVAAARSLAHG
ncbi:MAG TPA: alpha/beta hydrolase-fold protein [Gaiellaceae bacterium]|nr:alpha/beta hydrolase-fold protein [Gaiellaceae bacterium]